MLIQSRKFFFIERLKHRQALWKDLREWFRSEYLSLLIEQPNVRSSQRTVLVGAYNQKKVHWPLESIKEFVHGKDGKVRLVKLQKSYSEILRPFQRIYPLELSSTDNAEKCFLIQLWWQNKTSSLWRTGLVQKLISLNLRDL